MNLNHSGTEALLGTRRPRRVEPGRKNSFEKNRDEGGASPVNVCLHPSYRGERRSLQPFSCLFAAKGLVDLVW